MAIVTNIITGQNMSLAEMACTLEAKTIKIDPPDPSIDFDFCGYRCPFKEKVFGDVENPSDELKNDVSSIQFTLNSENSTVKIFLNPENGDPIELIDDTYGTYFPPGSFPDNKKIRGGYYVEWLKVLQDPSLGIGKYTLSTEVTEFAPDPKITESWVYDLKPFSTQEASGTIRLELIQNGVIKRSLDYSTMNWYHSLRVSGIFVNNEARTEESSYLDSRRKKLQNQTSITSIYKCLFRQMPVVITRLLKENYLLANELYLTDYGIFSHDPMNKIAVATPEINTIESEGGNGFADYEVQFEERVQDVLKRNP